MMAIWLQVKVCGRRVELRSRLFVCSAYDTQRRESSSVQLVAFYKCFAFTFCAVTQDYAMQCIRSVECRQH